MCIYLLQIQSKNSFRAEFRFYVNKNQILQTDNGKLVYWNWLNFFFLYPFQYFLLQANPTSSLWTFHPARKKKLFPIPSGSVPCSSSLKCSLSFSPPCHHYHYHFPSTTNDRCKVPCTVCGQSRTKKGAEKAEAKPPGSIVIIPEVHFYSFVHFPAGVWARKKIARKNGKTNFPSVFFPPVT